MKRTLMMLVAMLATVASVQAADVKVNLQNRGADQQMVAAQNVKYSISNAEGEIVASGENSRIDIDLPEGNYEISVEQTTPSGDVRYGTQAIEVTADGVNIAYEITPNGLRPIGPQAPKGLSTPTIPRQPIPTNPNLPPQLPQLPQQGGVPTMNSGNNWGVLALVGALVATAIALGVDNDEVTPVQR